MLGALPDYQTGSGYQITPVIGAVSGDPRLVANPEEVDDIFEVPLSFLMDTTNRFTSSRTFEGETRYFYEMPYGKHRIWGVTAGLIAMMGQVVQG